MTRRDLPRGEAPTVARHRDSIPHPVSSEKDGQLVFRGSPPRTHRRDDHATSIEAGKQANLSRGQELVLEQHRQNPDGLADFELYELVPDEWPPTLGRRRGDLVEQGLIEPTLFKRMSPRGRDAIVWRITDAGREVAR